YSVDQIVAQARNIRGNIGIAYTYNEPTVFYEFMLDVAKAAHSEGLKNVMVTNGYIEQEPLQQLLPHIDAFNVDLKAFNDSFYHKLTNSHLEPVKQALIQLRKAQKYFEITNLVIPGQNDSLEEFSAMIDWIHNNLGAKTVLHLSRYFPRYQFTVPSTKDSLLNQFYSIARQKLNYVYLGNVGDLSLGHDTVCVSCGSTLIERSGYTTNSGNLTVEGNCKQCGSKTDIIC
ncbi:MAG TPA: radical SAM protein, partial [Bacteroidales bacterium]